MGKKFKKAAVLLTMALFFAASPKLHAAKTTDVSRYRQQFQRIFPNTRIDSFQPVKDIDGLYEVVTKGGKNIIYYYPKTGRLIFGEIWTVDGKSITAQKLKELARARFEKVAKSRQMLSKALKVGNGPIKVIEVSDPQCPFCRRANAFLEKYSAKLTRYIYLFPLSYHKKSRDEALYILSAKDAQKAHHDAYTGSLDKDKDLQKKIRDRKKAERLLAEQMKVIRKLGITGVPTFYINGEIINGANIQKLAKAIGATVEERLNELQ